MQRLLRLLPVRMALEVDRSGFRLELPRLLRPLSRSIAAAQIASVEVRDGIVMRPFGVWGFLSGFGVRIVPRFGRVYNFGFNRGVAIRLEQGDRLVVGSRRPEQLAAALSEVQASGRPDQTTEAAS